MKKATDVFDRLDHVLGNYTEGLADESDVVVVAKEVNKYILLHPHPDDIFVECSEHYWASGAVRVCTLCGIREDGYRPFRNYSDEALATSINVWNYGHRIYHQLQYEINLRNRS